MELPLDITWRHVPSSPTVTEHIRERVEKLQQFCDRIIGCRVVVDAPHRHHRQGRLYEVSVDLTVPGRQLVADRAPHQDHAHEDVLVAVRDAFEAAERRLEDWVREHRDAQRAPQTVEAAPRAGTSSPPRGVLHRVQELLDADGVEYTVASHAPAFTAQEVAAAQHESGRHCAKVVMVRAGDRLLMAVLAAPDRLDPDKLPIPGGRLADEADFAPTFPHCDLGAMPPFGNLYGVPTYVDRMLAAEDEIVFQAGRHDQTVRMRYADYARLVEPIVGDFRSTHEEV